MKEIFYVEMIDYKNEIDWVPIGAFTNEKAAEAYAEERMKATEGKLYVVQSLRIIL